MGTYRLVNYNYNLSIIYIFCRRQITIKNIENDIDARKIVPEKRKCRYINENILNVYPYYSYTACTVQCRKNAQMRLCNCTNFFMPNTSESEKCNISGILCLNEYVQQLSVSFYIFSFCM